MYDITLSYVYVRRAPPAKGLGGGLKRANGCVYEIFSTYFMYGIEQLLHDKTQGNANAYEKKKKRKKKKRKKKKKKEKRGKKKNCVKKENGGKTVEEKKNGMERDVRKRMGKREIYIYVQSIYIYICGFI